MAAHFETIKQTILEWIRYLREVAVDYRDRFKVWITSFKMPTVQEVKDDALAYKSFIQEGVQDATDPGYTSWESMKTPMAVLGLFALFWLLCFFLSTSQEDGRPVSSFHSLFLKFQMLAFAVNVVLFFTPMLIWWAQGKLIRLLTLALETVQKKYNMAPLLKAYVGLKLLLFLNSFFTLVQKEYNPRGRSLNLFHLGLVPINAWVGLKYFPGGKLTSCMAVDIIMDYLVSIYSVLESVYRHMHRDALEIAARLVCVMQIIMHVIALHRLSSLVNLWDMETYNPVEMTYTTRFLAWICFYCVVSIVCLCIILTGMAYCYMNNESPRIHYKRPEQLPPANATFSDGSRIAPPASATGGSVTAGSAVPGSATGGSAAGVSGTGGSAAPGSTPGSAGGSKTGTA